MDIPITLNLTENERKVIVQLGEMYDGRLLLSTLARNLSFTPRELVITLRALQVLKLVTPMAKFLGAGARLTSLGWIEFVLLTLDQDWSHVPPLYRGKK